MKKVLLFTDGSVNVQKNVGIGATLMIFNNELLASNLKDRIKTMVFENTSSTKLELQTLLWAMEDFRLKNQHLTIFTDSQNIARLPGRREGLERSRFISKKGITLKNADLYRQFYQFMDLFKIEIIKIKGHQPSKKKDDIERIFTLVDRASRKGLREYLIELKNI